MNLSTLSRTKNLTAVLVLAGAVMIGLFAIPAISKNTPTFGPIPDEVLEMDGAIDGDLVTDYVPALDREGNVAGYVKATDILEIDGKEPTDGPIPVVSRDLELVGHMVPARGFVPLGTQFESVPRIPVTVLEMLPDGTEQVTTIK